MPLIETNGLDIPSWEAEVGTLTNGLFNLNAVILATSTERPPPRPIIKSGESLILVCSLFTESMDASLTIYHESCKEDSKNDDLQDVHALAFTLLPVIIATFEALSSRSIIKEPSWEITPSPISIFRGNSIK